MAKIIAKGVDGWEEVAKGISGTDCPVCPSHRARSIWGLKTHCWEKHRDLTERRQSEEDEEYEMEIVRPEGEGSYGQSSVPVSPEAGAC